MARRRLDFECGGSVRFDVTATEALRMAGAVVRMRACMRACMVACVGTNPPPP